MAIEEKRREVKLVDEQPKSVVKESSTHVCQCSPEHRDALCTHQ